MIDMIFPARCHCGSNSSEHRFGEQRWLCTHCKRQMWMPIETVPRDVEILLLAPERSIYIGECWTDYTEKDEPPYFMVLEIGQIYPTHWMPLPEPPKDD